MFVSMAKLEHGPRTDPATQGRPERVTAARSADGTYPKTSSANDPFALSCRCMPS